jgi:hypothetical protein
MVGVDGTGLGRRLIVLVLFSSFSAGSFFAACAQTDRAPPPRASGPTISEGAALQMAAILAIKTSRTEIAKKIDSRAYLGMLHQRKDPRLALLIDYHFVTADADGKPAAVWSSRPTSAAACRRWTPTRRNAARAVGVALLR